MLTGQSLDGRFKRKSDFRASLFWYRPCGGCALLQQWVVHVQRLFLCQPVKSVGATLRWGADQAGYGRILQKFQNIGCASPFGNQHSTLSQLHSAVDRWWIYTTTKHRGEGGSACGVRALQRHDQATGGIMGLLPLLLSSTERSNDEGSKNKRHTTTYGSPTLSLGRRTWHPWHSCPFSFVEMSTLNACTLDLGFWDKTPSRDGQLSGYVCSSSQNAQTHPCYIRGFWSVEEMYTPRNGQFALIPFLFILVNKSCGSIHPTWSWGTAPVTQKIWHDFFLCFDVHSKLEMPNTDILSHIFETKLW